MRVNFTREDVAFANPSFNGNGQDQAALKPQLNYLTFVDQQNPRAPTEAQYPFGAWEYPERLIANNPAKPLRVFLQVGEMDNGYTMNEASHHNWVLANQRVAAALKAKGYHYRFVYALGGTHCDTRVRQQTLPDTLQWIWRGFTGR